MKTSVIVSTYNSPRWLEKSLWGFFAQKRLDFELLIADDGSRDETRQLLERLAAKSPVPLAHVWQTDDGFQRCRVLNKALAVARGERILQIDGDCIPRDDFMDVHSRFDDPAVFVTGGYFKMPMSVSEAITEADVHEQRAFQAGWLMSHGLRPTAKLLKVLARPPVDEWLNRLTRARLTWNGHGASCLRSQAIQVNGFNEDMQYGGADVEFGVRLNHIGVQARQVRYSTFALHLHHGRGYITPEMLANSSAVKQRTRSERLTRADRGLDQWLQPDGRVTLHPDDRVTWFRR